MNGLEAAEKIRQIDPHIYIVFVTAYSDLDLSEITQRIRENVLFIRKPFQSEEIEQIARNFSLAWQKDRELEVLQAKLNEKVERNLFEAAMYEISSSVLLSLADKVNAQAGLTAYLISEFDVLPAQRKDYEAVTKTLLSESKNFANMITSLQRMALPSGEVSVFSLWDLVEQVRGLIPELSQLPDNVAFDVAYELDRDTALHLPCNHLVIALSALVRNSLEAIGKQLSVASGTNGQIRLSFSAIPDNQLKITLQDNGVGLNANQLNQAFIQGYSTKTGHIGIGLTVVENFITEVGGSVALQSDGIGQGACFTVILPFSIR